jgi:FKBP-type peptidyl-prolyl cis-trans isomerase SlyD
MKQAKLSTAASATKFFHIYTAQAASLLAWKNIPASDAYGKILEDRVQVISRDMFEGIDNIEVGMQFHADVSEGPGVVTVIAIDGENITIDGNHPLAGMPLHFEIEVMDVRPATEEEIEHGHIHGAGGHHH